MGADKLGGYFALQEQYQALYAEYVRRGVVRDLDVDDIENIFDAEWKLPHYFAVGADALRIVIDRSSAANGCLLRPSQDFPCGSGRVTRHLLSFFPAARLVACDLYEHVRFCTRVLGAHGVISRKNLDEVEFRERFDLVFCGSLLTHLPEHLLRAALRLLDRSLSDTGIAVVTLHGRHAEYIQKHKWKYIDDPLFEIAETRARESGFGYVDYQDAMREDFDKQAEYGIALVRPRWIAGVLECETGLRILSYCERDWDDHQDVLVFGKPGINERA